MKNFPHEVAKYIRYRLPRLIAKYAIDHFKDNFRKGGFVDNGLKTWQEPKRLNADSDVAAEKYGPLLSARKELMESITYTVTGTRIVLTSNKPYAQIHNEGGTIQIPVTPKMRAFAWARHKEVNNGRKEGDAEIPSPWKGLALTKKQQLNVTIPQRQFIGHSHELDDIIAREINSEIEKLFKQHGKPL
jgi:phage gpG-like protein